MSPRFLGSPRHQQRPSRTWKDLQQQHVTLSNRGILAVGTGSRVQPCPGFWGICPGHCSVDFHWRRLSLARLPEALSNAVRQPVDINIFHGRREAVKVMMGQSAYEKLTENCSGGKCTGLVAEAYCAGILQIKGIQPISLLCGQYVKAITSPSTHARNTPVEFSSC